MTTSIPETNTERMTAEREKEIRRVIGEGDQWDNVGPELLRELDATRKERDEARGQLINARLCFEDMERQRDEARNERDAWHEAWDRGERWIRAVERLDEPAP